MKRALILLLVVLIAGCATLAMHPDGTVLAKFARETYAEAGAIYMGQWIPAGFAHRTTWWTIVQGPGYVIEYKMEKTDWENTKVGDVIVIPGDEGGT